MEAFKLATDAIAVYTILYTKTAAAFGALLQQRHAAYLLKRNIYYAYHDRRLR
jgi:hypothetical protein